MLNAPPILLAEDESNDAVLLERAFRKAGWQAPIVRVHDGEQVIDYLLGTGTYSDRMRYPLPSLLLLDLRMPKRSGFEVLEWLQARNDFPELLVVVVGTWDLASEVRRAYDLGATMFLVKSSNFGLLVEHVKKLQTYWLLQHEQRTFGLPEAV